VCVCVVCMCGFVNGYIRVCGYVCVGLYVCRCVVVCGLRVCAWCVWMCVAMVVCVCECVCVCVWNMATKKSLFRWMINEYIYMYVTLVE
jgi:hypothetical protein